MILGLKPYTAIRFTNGTTDSNGEYQDSVASSFGITAYIEEASPRTLIVLDDEGARTKAKFVMVTEPDAPELEPMIVLPKRRADRVIYKGREYSIGAKRDNTDHTEGIPHYWYTLSEIGADEP